MKRTPLKRGGWLLRRTGLRTVGKKTRRDRAELALARPELYARSHGECEAHGFAGPRCTGMGVHAHHVLPHSHGGHNSLDGLLLVCWACHRAIHDNPAEAYARGLLRHSWDDDAA